MKRHSPFKFQKENTVTLSCLVQSVKSFEILAKEYGLGSLGKRRVRMLRKWTTSLRKINKMG